MKAPFPTTNPRIPTVTPIYQAKVSQQQILLHCYPIMSIWRWKIKAAFLLKNHQRQYHSLHRNSIQCLSRMCTQTWLTKIIVMLRIHWDSMIMLLFSHITPICSKNNNLRRFLSLNCYKVRTKPIHSLQPKGFKQTFLTQFQSQNKHQKSGKVQLQWIKPNLTTNNNNISHLVTTKYKNSVLSSITIIQALKNSKKSNKILKIPKIIIKIHMTEIMPKETKKTTTTWTSVLMNGHLKRKRNKFFTKSIIRAIISQSQFIRKRTLLLTTLKKSENGLRLENETILGWENDLTNNQIRSMKMKIKNRGKSKKKSRRCQSCKLKFGKKL